MQPHHVRPQVERRHAANQLAGLIQVRGQVQQDHVRLGLTHPDFQRLERRIGLELREDLKGTGALEGGREMGRQLAIGNDRKRRQNWSPARHRAILPFLIRGAPTWP